MSNIFNLFPEIDYSGYIVPKGNKMWSFSPDILDWDNITISTENFMQKEKVSENEIWFVKLPGNFSLQKMKVTKLYEKVVELKTEVMSFSTAYKLSDVEFVEKVS